jgi:hypothetical protein
MTQVGSFLNIKLFASYCEGPGVLLIFILLSASEVLYAVPILNSGWCFS